MKSGSKSARTCNSDSSCRCRSASFSIRPSLSTPASCVDPGGSGASILTGACALSSGGALTTEGWSHVAWRNLPHWFLWPFPASKHVTPFGTFFFVGPPLRAPPPCSRQLSISTCCFCSSSCVACSPFIRSTYFAIFNFFLLDLACAICCTTKQSILLRLPQLISISIVHSGRLIGTSFKFGCEESRCTNVLTDPASCLFMDPPNSGSRSCAAGSPSPPCP